MTVSARWICEIATSGNSLQRQSSYWVAYADPRTAPSIHPKDCGLREIGEVLPYRKQPHQYPLRISASRTRRNACAWNAAFKQYARNCLKAVHGRQIAFRVHTAQNSPLRTQRIQARCFFRKLILKYHGGIFHVVYAIAFLFPFGAIARACVYERGLFERVWVSTDCFSVAVYQSIKRVQTARTSAYCFSIASSLSECGSVQTALVLQSISLSNEYRLLERAHTALASQALWVVSAEH